mmetsp:Transcript_26133/g.59615  ORF Transcript_26133/g.59615 Transcript_26133/m.59615 type:complete len:226 (+) Transcript_26133:94-771(+)
MTAVSARGGPVPSAPSHLGCSRLRGRAAERALDEGVDALLHEYAVLEGARGVALVREEEELVVLLRADQRVDQARRVPEVHVLVDQPVHQEEGALDVIDVSHDGAARVAVGVALGRAHVALGVVGVVAVPARHGRAGHPHLEDVRGARQGHRGHVPAVAPPVDAHSLRVGQALCDGPLDASLLILHFQVAHVPLDLRLEEQPAPRTPAVVDLQHKVPLRAQELRA